MPELTTQQRNEEIVRQYNDGVSGPELAVRFRISPQRINQILRALGAVEASEARALRAEGRRRGREESVQDFLTRYGESLAALAAAESPRVEVEGAFAILAPEYPETVRSEALRSPGLMFAVNREEYVFGQVMIEIGVWYAIAEQHDLRGDVPMALNELTFAEMAEFSASIIELGASGAQIKQILVAAAAARLQVQAEPGLAITKDAYGQQRRAIIDRLGLSEGRGGFVWPPTSQTVKNRLGAGYWSDALTAIGIEPSARGRRRGLLLFTDEDYREAMVNFVEHCDETGAPRSYDSYEAWVLNQDRAGRQWPSGPSVRLHYGTWTTAKRRALSADGAESQREIRAPGAASLARTALHDANVERRELLELLPDVAGRDRAAKVTEFVTTFMGTYEVRRRNWFRALVMSDPDAVPRRLASTPALAGRHRVLLEATPPDLEGVMADMYVDRLLAGNDGSRTSEQWLAVDVRAELAVVGAKDVAAAKALREMRNFFTHDSEESKEHVTTALAELGEHDGTFLRSGPITRRTLAAWLSSSEYGRLMTLTESVLTHWRAMLAAEAVAAG